MKKSQEVKILLVEDNEIDRKAIHSALGRANFRSKITDVTTGGDAQQSLKNSHFDCVLMAYKLPDMDGLELLTKIRAKETDLTVPVILLNGPEIESLTLDALHAGAQDFLEKNDLGPVRLGHAIQSSIERQNLLYKNREYQKAIEARAHYLKVVTDTMSDGLLVTDETGRIISANKSCARIFGHTQNDLAGEDIGLVLGEKEAGVFKKALQNYARDGKNANLDKIPKEAKGRHSGGRPLTLEMEIAATQENDKLLFVVSLSDITKQKAAEENYKILADYTNDIVVLENRESTLLFASPSLTRHLGYSIKEVLGTNTWDIIHPDDIKEKKDHWEHTVIVKKEHCLTEYRFRHKNGHYLWFESLCSPIISDQGEVTGVVSTSREISARKEAENKLETLAENTSDIITLRDAKGKGIYTTPSFERVLGYPRNIMEEGGFYHELVHPDDHEKLREWEKVVFKERKSHRYDLRFKTRKGEYLWFESHSEPVFDENGKFKGVVTQARDITDYKKAEEARLEAEKMFKMIAENSNDIIALRDPKGKVLFVTPSYEKQLGYDFQNQIGSSAFGLLHPDDRKWFPDAWKETVVQKGLVYTASIRLKHKKGHYIWFESANTPVKDENGKVINVVSSSRNLTESKKAEAEKTSLGEIIENSLNEIFIFTAKDMKLLMANQGARTNLGYSKTKLLGKPITSFIQLNKQELARLLKPLFKGDKAQVLVETVMTREDGTGYDIQAWIQLTEYDGTPAYVAMIEDVTEKKLAAEKLRQSQKMDAIGNLTGGVAHDFNNLLTAILGSLQYLQTMNDKLPKEAKELIEIAVSSGKRGADLTRRLLALSRKQDLQPKILNANDLMNELFPLLKRTIRENIEIITNFPEEPCFIKVDKGELENSLLNLAVNAQDAMPSGGKLVFEISRESLTGESPELKTLQLGNYVVISVSDTGTGIPSNIQKKIFEPFFTTKDVDKGTGLGLSMVYGFVGQSGGEITLYSEEGIGTTFRIYLPEASVKGAVVKKVKPENILHGKHKGTILLVEDDEGVRAFIIRALEAKGYEVVVAKDGAAAVKKMKSRKDFDLLLTDVVLPKGVSGFEVAKEFKKKFPAKGVILSSGYTRATLEEKADVELTDDILTKPFDLEVLVSKIQEKIITSLH